MVSPYKQLKESRGQEVCTNYAPNLRKHAECDQMASTNYHNKENMQSVIKLPVLIIIIKKRMIHAYQGPQELSRPRTLRLQAYLKCHL